MLHHAASPSPPPGLHSVQFYEDEGFLGHTVGEFLTAGLIDEQACIVIATAAHRALFTERLTRRGLDVARLVDSGRLTFLDARDTLARVMAGALPDPARFAAVIGAALDELLLRSSRSSVRAYGEMVDLLWQDGNADAAIQLEALWNALADKYAFSLLCAYSLGGFFSEAHSGPFVDICRAHTHVQPAEGFAQVETDDARAREIARLQQRAQALEQEIDTRKGLEQALRQTLADQQRAEADLRTRENELRHFFENAAEGLHWVAPDGTILWANRAELDMVGRDRDEYVGHHLREFHADPEVLEDLLSRLGRNETVQNFEARLRRKDGSSRDVLITSDVDWKDGTFAHTRCFTRDVTELKQTQAELVEAVRARDEFISIASHELRNPLHAIHLQLLSVLHSTSQGTEAPSPAWLQSRLTRASAQVTRLGRLLDNLLDVSRLTAGRLSLEPETVDLADVISMVTDRFAEQLGSVKLNLTLTPCVGHWDRLRLDQIVTNLLSNAIKFGEGRAVDVELEAGEAGVRLRVRDRGPGISRDNQERLFARFERAVAAQRIGGFGLGLWITRQIVEAMGGTISVESELGAGALFTVTLPRTVATTPVSWAALVEVS